MTHKNISIRCFLTLLACFLLAVGIVLDVLKFKGDDCIYDEKVMMVTRLSIPIHIRGGLERPLKLFPFEKWQISIRYAMREF